LRKEIQKEQQEKAKLQAAVAKLQEENKQLLVEIGKFKRRSEFEVEMAAIVQDVNERVRKRVTPEFVTKVEDDEAQTHKTATIMQIKLEKHFERESESKKLKRSQVSKAKRNVHWLRMERRRLKNLKNTLATDANTLARLWERQNKAESDLNRWKKMFEKHLDGRVPIDDDDSLAAVLKGARDKLKEHSEIENQTIAARIKRDGTLSELKNLLFTLERALTAENYGLADPEEEQLKKQLEAERAVRMRYEEKHDQAIINAKEAGAKLVETAVKFSDQLFPSAPDKTELPQIVTKTIDFLEQRAIAVENIFEKTEYQGLKVKQIKKYFDSEEGYDIDLSKCGDFKIVGELLKAYFRELVDPLIPIEISDKFTIVLKGKNNIKVSKLTTFCRNTREGGKT
jgi:myosin heavy subunit